MRSALAPLILFLLSSTCPGPRDRVRPSPGGAAGPVPSLHRVMAVERTHPLYGRVEGERLRNDCSEDSQCRVGGCSGEVCSAQAGVTTSCEVQEWPQGRAVCGCVEGQCLWYHPSAAPGTIAPGQGQPCPRGDCAAGLACVSYYGIAGAKGPLFSSCEISCAASDSKCPEGQTCVTLADGPGRVCRPRI